MAALKIKSEHQNIIKPLLINFLNVNAEQVREHIKHLRVLVIQGKVKDIERRLCFDVLYALRKTNINEVESFISEVYKTCDDNHIYSFLKSTIKPKNLLN